MVLLLSFERNAQLGEILRCEEIGAVKERLTLSWQARRTIIVNGELSREQRLYTLYRTAFGAVHYD